MGFLRLLPLALLAGCYSPELADCTVACGTDNDCGTGQSCVAGMCASEGVTCSGSPGEDAAVTPEDAPMPDPDAPPAEQGVLRIKIGDQGVVHVPGHEPCDSMVAPECMYIIERGTPITLDAEPHPNRFFEKWEETPQCMGISDPTCTVTPMGFETRVTAKFKKL